MTILQLQALRWLTRDWARGLALLVVAWAVYAHVWPQAPEMRSDSRGYVEVAADLQDLQLSRLHDRTYGYPALLAATGAVAGPTRALFHVQLALYLTAVGFALVFLRRCAVPARGSVVFLLVALAPPSVALTASVLTEACTASLLTIGIVSLLFWLGSGRWGWLVLGSVLLGYAAVVRPTYLLVCVPVGIGLLITRRFDVPHRRRYTMATLAVAAAALAFGGGLVAYNAARFGFTGATPLFGFNLSTRTARVVERLPAAYAPVRDLLVAARDRALVAGDDAHTGVMFIWPTRDALRQATGLSEPALSRYMLRLNLALIRAAPLNYLQEVARSAADYWFPWVPDLANFGSRPLQLLWSLVQSVVVGLFLLQVLLLAGAACTALVLPAVRPMLGGAVRATQPLALGGSVLAILITLYTMLVSTAVDIGNPRYRSPTELLVWLATILLVDAWRRSHRGARAR